MIIKLQKDISTVQKEQLLLTLRGSGFYLQENGHSSLIRIAGNSGALPKEKIENLPGVEAVIDSGRSYHLVSREYQPENTIIELNGISIGGDEPLVIAGPCAVESEDQILRTARLVKSAGVKIMRGGAFKPRTSPYSFTGLEEKGLQLLSQARQETGVLIITEVLDTADVELVAEHSDILQIGSRNMQNYKLLKAVGRQLRPVMLKRGMSATLEEFLGSAEYIISEGNKNIFLCERGIRTFVEYTRNTLDLNIVPVIKKISHLPIIVDPSHGTGRRDIIEPMSLAALAAGADGIMVEVHPDPPASWSDPDQALYPEQFLQLMESINQYIQWRKNAAIKSHL
jgi:3-deoxy-7-phosphoheptulonate synthase